MKTPRLRSNPPSLVGLYAAIDLDLWISKVKEDGLQLLCEYIRVIDCNFGIPLREDPFCDLMWSDSEEIETWTVSPRGAGWLFGSRVTAEEREVKFFTETEENNQSSKDRGPILAMMVVIDTLFFHLHHFFPACFVSSLEILAVNVHVKENFNELL